MILLFALLACGNIGESLFNKQQTTEQPKKAAAVNITVTPGDCTNDVMSRLTIETKDGEVYLAKARLKDTTPLADLTFQAPNRVTRTPETISYEHEPLRPRVLHPVNDVRTLSAYDNDPATADIIVRSGKCTPNVSPFAWIEYGDMNTGKNVRITFD